MRQFLKTSLLAGIPFGIATGIFFAFMDGPTFGGVGGMGCGLLFGPSMAAFAAYQRTKFKSDYTLADGELLLKEGPANHFQRGEGVGGWLYLTQKELYFKLHKVNIQVHELSIPLEDILRAEAVATV